MNTTIHRAKTATEEIRLIERATAPYYAIIINTERYAEFQPLPLDTSRREAVATFVRFVDLARASSTAKPEFKLEAAE